MFLFFFIEIISIAICGAAFCSIWNIAANRFEINKFVCFIFAATSYVLSKYILSQFVFRNIFGDESSYRQGLLEAYIKLLDATSGYSTYAFLLLHFLIILMLGWRQLKR
jgi:hypothetical protein